MNIHSVSISVWAFFIKTDPPHWNVEHVKHFYKDKLRAYKCNITHIKCKISKIVAGKVASRHQTMQFKPDHFSVV